MDDPASCFLRAALPSNAGSEQTLLERLLLLYLSQIPDSAIRLQNCCLLEDAGDVVVHLLETLAGFANYVSHGDPSNSYVDRQIQGSAEEDGLSDLGIVDYLDDKHMGLKNVAAIISEAAARSRDTWKLTPPRPTLIKSIVSASASWGHNELYTLTPPGSSTNSNNVGVDLDHNLNVQSNSIGFDRTFLNTLESVNPVALNDLDPTCNSLDSTSMSQGVSSLTSRGKGQYMCPEGLRCTKGGVDADGHLIVFERNSAFRAHLDKHQKRYRCDLPGCPNQTGFARVDQLERHKQLVKHHANA